MARTSSSSKALALIALAVAALIVGGLYACAIDAGSPSDATSSEGDASVDATFARVDADHRAGANILEPRGPAGGGLTGTYPNPGVAAIPTTGTPGTCALWTDAGTLASASCGGPDGSVPVFNTGQDLATGSTGSALSSQIVVQLTGDGGTLPVFAGAQNVQFAADASAKFTQVAVADGGGTSMVAAPQACANSATNTSSGNFAVNLSPTCGDAGEAALAVVRDNPDGGTGWTVARLQVGPGSGAPPWSAGCLELGNGAAATSQYNCEIWDDPTQNGPMYLTATSQASNSRMFLSAWSSDQSAYQNILTLLPNSGGPGLLLSAVPQLDFASNAGASLITQVIQSGDVATTSLSVFAQSAYSGASTHVNGAPLYLGGGASKTNGTTGLRGPARLIVGADESETLIESAECAVGQRVSVLNQIGGGINASCIPNGDGVTVIYPASTNVTTCDSSRGEIWADNSSGALYGCNPGGAPYLLDSSAGISSLTGDVTGTGPGATPTTIGALQGNPVLASGGNAPGNGQVLGFNGSDWLPVTPASGCNNIGSISGDVVTSAPGSCGAGVSGTIQKLQGNPLTVSGGTAPSTGQVLGFNGSSWLPVTNSSTVTLGGDVQGASGSNVVHGIGNGLSLVSVHASELEWDSSTAPYLYGPGTGTFTVQGGGEILLASSGSSPIVLNAGTAIDLQLFGSNQVAITTSAVVTTPATFEFASTASSPIITQASSGSGQPLTIRPATATTGLAAGQSLKLIGGVPGSFGTPGDVTLVNSSSGNTIASTSSVAEKFVRNEGVRERVNIQSGLTYSLLTTDHIVIMTTTSGGGPPPTATMPSTPSLGDDYVVCTIIGLQINPGAGQTINASGSNFMLNVTTNIACVELVATSSTTWLTIAASKF